MLNIWLKYLKCLNKLKKNFKIGITLFKVINQCVYI